jgi:short-subunit dehydrogenase
MRVFITGASSGLGEGLARHYARQGATVGLCARRADVLAGVARAIEDDGGRAAVYTADVGDTAAMAKAAGDFAAENGGADLVIANAGIGIPHQTLQGKSEPIARLLRINVIGVTNTIVPFVPVMVAQGAGTLVAMGSAAGERGLPGRAAYSASKAALATFMDALRLDLHGTGVHAMTLCPGFVHTPLTAKLPGKLPFVLELEPAVAQMAAAIERRERRFLFPWQIRLFAGVYRMAPEWLVRRMAPPARSAKETPDGG